MDVLFKACDNIPNYGRKPYFIEKLFNGWWCAEMEVS